MGIEARFVYGDDVYIPEEYLEETWEPVRECCDLYYVSDMGRVWSVASQDFLKVKPMDRRGHLGVCLYDRGQRKYRYIHRLMAEAFTPNPDGYPVVRHLDDDPSNNVLDNLKWGTQKDNMRDCIDNGHAHFVTNEERYKGLRPMMTPVIATDLETGEELWFESQGEAGRSLGVPQANVYKVLVGERRQAGGYSFRRAGENE